MDEFSVRSSDNGLVKCEDELRLVDVSSRPCSGFVEGVEVFGVEEKLEECFGF